MKYTIGLDMSTKSSGYSVFADDKLVTYGLWQKDNSDWRERCVEMGKCLSKLLTSYPDSIIYCEDTIGTPNIATIKKLSVLQGVILGIATAHNVKIYFLSPSTWRSELELFTGSRKDTERELMKEHTVNYINKQFGLDLFYKYKSAKSQDDIADSIAIAWSRIKP